MAITQLVTPMPIPVCSSSAAGLTVNWGALDTKAIGYQIDLYLDTDTWYSHLIATTTVYGANTTTATLGGLLQYNTNYTIRVKALADPESEYTDSGYGTMGGLTYTYQATYSDPYTNSTFKIRDYDDEGNQVDYIGSDWVTFVIDHATAGAQFTQFYIKKSTDSEYTQINNGYLTNGTTASGTSGDYDWEAGEYDSGWFNGWAWLSLLNLEPETTYTARAFAVHDSNCYPTQTAVEITFTTLSAATQLDVPTGLACASRTTTSVSLTWNAVSNASGYEAVCTLNGTDTTLTPTTNSCEFTGLTPGTTYSFKVKAVGDGDDYLDSDYTSPSLDVLTQTQLATPTISAYPRASNDSKYSTLQFRLAATIANATTYEYQLSETSTFETILQTRNSSTVTSGYPMSGYFTGLTEGARYYCRARAKSSNDDYAPSEWSGVKNTTVTAHLAAPVVEVVDITQTSAKLTWGAVPNRTSYTAGYRLAGETTWNNATGLTGTQRELTGLTEGATYEYQVGAIGNGSTFTTTWGEVGTFTTNNITKLPAPTGLNVSNIGTTTSTLNWDEVANATGYTVQWRKSGASAWNSQDVEA